MRQFWKNLNIDCVPVDNDQPLAERYYHLHRLRAVLEIVDQSRLIVDASIACLLALSISDSFEIFSVFFLSYIRKVVSEIFLFHKGPMFSILKKSRSSGTWSILIVYTLLPDGYLNKSLFMIMGLFQNGHRRPKKDRAVAQSRQFVGPSGSRLSDILQGCLCV